MIFELLSNPKDIHPLASIWEDAEHREDFKGASENWLKYYTGIEDYLDKHMFMKKEGRIYVLKEDNVSIGVSGWCACAAPILKDCGFMRWHGITKNYRGKGYSRWLLTFIIVNAGIQGVKTIYELSDTDKAKEFFLHVGFTIETNPDIIKAVRCEAGDFKHVLRYEVNYTTRS